MPKHPFEAVNGRHRCLGSEQLIKTHPIDRLKIAKVRVVLTVRARTLIARGAATTSVSSSATQAGL
jgi:hypothetical protein